MVRKLVLYSLVIYAVIATSLLTRNFYFAFAAHGWTQNDTGVVVVRKEDVKVVSESRYGASESKKPVKIISYSYIHEGKMYHGDRLTFLGWSKRDYKNEDLVKVWFDPDEPSESVLEPDVTLLQIG